MRTPFPVRLIPALLALGLIASATPTWSAAAAAAVVKSAGAMTFIDADTLVVADWRGGRLHALTLPASAPGTSAYFNLKNVSASIARALHTSSDKLRFEDMAVRPGSETAYITLSVEKGAGAGTPALVAVDTAGKVKVVDLIKTPRVSTSITQMPSPDKRLCVEAGRALVVGETVSLRVLDERPGRAPAVKTWHVATPVSRPLDVEAWRWNPPRAGSRDALVVDLRTPISSTGEALIAVLDGNGRRVAGRTALGPDDAQWRFIPDKPWRREAYQVVAHPDLEDPAGNRRCAAFEALRASAIRCGEAGTEVAEE